MQANPMRGEANIGEHKLLVDVNSWCRLEAATGKKYADLLSSFQIGLNFGMTDLRQYIRVFITTPMTDEEVGDLITSLGMIEVEVPPELREKGQPKTQQVLAAADALRRAVEGSQAPKKEAKTNPPLAA